MKHYGCFIIAEMLDSDDQGFVIYESVLQFLAIMQRLLTNGPIDFDQTH